MRVAVNALLRMLCVPAALLLLCGGKASAVMIDPAGHGEVLLMPYYTVNAGQQTLLSVVNHSSSAKAVKVRFREGLNGREVYALNVYLDSFDVWTAAVFAMAETSAAGLITTDNSCIVPSIQTDPTLPTTPNGRRYALFGNADYSGDRADSGTDNVSRTRDGYIEVIEMGAIVESSESAVAAGHVRERPRDCDRLVQAWSRNGYWTEQPSRDLLRPGGQLSGTISIVDVPGGSLYSVAATALSRFSIVVQHSGPGAALPDLSSAVTEAAREKVESTVIAGGKIHRSYWPQARAFDAVTAALMSSRLRNEFNAESGLSAQSDWVLTFPTRRFYLPSAAPAQQLPFTTALNAGPQQQVCARPLDGGYSLYDRNSRKWEFDPLFSGIQLPNPTYCRATQLLGFGSVQALLAAERFERVVTGVAIGGNLINGWLDLRFDPAHRTGRALSGETYLGVPAIGFWALRYRNNAAKPGELGIYSSAIPHQRSVDCVDAAGLPCTGL